MKLTPVGPLPTAVYWRRRIAVFGALAALLIVTLYACGGSGEEDSGKPAAESKPSTPAQLPIETQTPDGGAGDGTPAAPGGSSDDGEGGDPGGDAPGGAEPEGAEPDPGQRLPAAPPASEVAVCADSALLLTVAAVKSSYPAGAHARFNLVIKNVSDQACKRDLGADQQELRLMAGQQRFWSSDDCSPAHGSRVVVLRASESFRFWVVWDGKSSVPGCKAARTPAKPGSYQLVGRLADKLSPAATVKLT